MVKITKIIINQLYEKKKSGNIHPSFMKLEKYMECLN